jgi:DNA polymerase-3 subunit delta
MASPAAKSVSPLALVCGDDEFSVKRRARQAFQEWCAEDSSTEAEIIDASASNSGEALKALARLREALQTFPFFGARKVVWFQNCNFLGDERAASAAAVTGSLADLAQELKGFPWKDTRLLISAGKVDKRKTFYKTLEKIGAVEHYAALNVDDRDWAAQAESWARQELRALKKKASDEALATLVACVGPNARQLSNEAQKLALYLGEREKIELEDVAAIVTRNKQARAFALSDALGDRNLPRVLRTLDEELWSLKVDSQKSEIGLLYGLIGKVRVLILLQEMLRQDWIDPDAEYPRFKAQLEGVPADAFPQDKRINPLAMNAYVLFKALPQARNYTSAELVRAMELLLECNRRLVSSGLDEGLVLQQTLVQIVNGRRSR